MNETCHVSIIMPIYNGAQHVRSSIQSVLNQTCAQFELLLINDGSIDESGEICDTYAAQDKRIRVWHTANQGVSLARNVGLQHAKGTWLLFLDSDDILQPDVVRLIVENETLDPSLQMLMGSYRHVYPLHTIHMSNTDLCADGFSTAFEFGTEGVKACIGSFAVKRELVEHYHLTFFAGSKYGEDVEFMNYCMFHAVKVKVLTHYFVHYMVHEHSAIAKASFARFHSFEARQRTLAYLKRRFPEEHQLIALFEHRLLPRSLMKTVMLLCRSKVSVYKIMRYLDEHGYIEVLRQASTNDLTPMPLRGEMRSFLNGPLLIWTKCLLEGYYYNLRRALGMVKRAVMR